MEQLESITLYCLKMLRGERTIFSIYHLLTGKKSSQTIQDAHLYSMKSFFGICDGMAREWFETIIHRLHEKGWILNNGDQRFLLSEKGEILLAKNPPPVYLNGWAYHQVTPLFWGRLSLFIQVISNLAVHQTNYIPIQKDKNIQIWIKTVLRRIKIPKQQIAAKAYEELMNCFLGMEEIDPGLIVFRLSGNQQIGLTSRQAARKFKIDFFEYQISFLHALHYLLSKIKQDSIHFPLLNVLIVDLNENNELTLSTQKTLELLSLGNSLEMIASIRNLRMSTIEDHLVELAFHLPDFSIETYVEKKLQNQILKISRQLGSKQLKLIKEDVKGASYFQIRLVLAKFGGE